MNYDDVYKVIGMVLLASNLLLVILCSKLYQLAYKDQLTGLGNSRYLYAKGNRLIKKCAEGEYACIFFIDLDHLKSINDDFSHTAGDAALKKLADELTSLFGKKYLLARKSGDEFIVATRCPSREMFETIRISLVEKMKKMEATWEEYDKDKSLFISATCGGVLHAATTITFEAMMAEADELMLANKKRRRSD